jgi:two-component system chemotaxis response regulator CheY
MRILVVDDEFVSLQKLSLYLKDKGMCEAATHAEQAYQMFCQAFKVRAPYDLITLDVDMPDYNGPELLKKIRNFEVENGITEKSQRVKIVMISSHQDGPSIMSSFSHGCDAYITKPYNKEDVMQALAPIGI